MKQLIVCSHQCNKEDEWFWLAAHMEEEKNVCEVLIGKLQESKHFEDLLFKRSHQY